MDLKVQSINKRLDALELRVLERLAPTIDISSFRTELDRLWVDLDAILVPSMDAPESAPTAPTDDTMLDALFSENIPQSESTRARGKRHRSSHTSDATEDAREKKRERQHTTYARRASIVDGELCQQRVRESALGASSFVPATEVVAAVRDDVSTIDGAAMIDGRATNGVPHVDPTGFGKPDPPIC